MIFVNYEMDVGFFFFLNPASILPLCNAMYISVYGVGNTTSSLDYSTNDMEDCHILFFLSNFLFPAPFLYIPLFTVSPSS